MIKVDYYPRPFKLDMSEARRLVVAQPGREPLAVGGWVGIKFTLGKAIPQGLQISGDPNDTVEGDGSYSFTPIVVGGLKPYTFELDGNLVAGFTFDASTGQLSRPPQ